MVFAHGVGSRGDLPIEFWQFTSAAIVALGVSFFALGVLWKQPRLAALSVGRSFPGLSTAATALRRPGQLVFLAVVALTVPAGLFGTQSIDANLAPVAIYVAFWVGMQVLVAVFGNVWQAASPIDQAVSLVGSRGWVSERSAPGWSRWLAPVGMTAFLFLELVHPSGDSPRVLGLAAVLYLGVFTIGGIRWGREWLRGSETFNVLFALIGAMAPIHRDDRASGAGASWRLRAPFAGLSGVQLTAPGLALILVMLGGTTFDGFSDSQLWRDLVGRQSGWTGAAVSAVGLFWSIALVAALYEVGVRFAASESNTKLHATRMDFGPSLVPIVFGYSIAHYAQLLVDEIQTFFFRLSDPFGKGWNLFGSADGTIDYGIVSVDLIAWIQVLSIVIGHIAAVMVAHDRALERFAAARAATSQYAMLLVMVLYSVIGLWLLLRA